MAPNMRYVNTGMTTVELSAQSFFGKLFPEANTKLYTVVEPNPPNKISWMMLDLGYVHASASGLSELLEHLPIQEHVDEVFSSDLIVYWGDFLQAKHYIETEAAGRLAGLYGLTEEDAVNQAYKLLLQANQADAIKEKTIIFGSSLLYNAVKDYSNTAYEAYLSDLARKCAAILVRDPVSAMRFNHLTGDYGTNFLGIDPAFLIQPKSIECLPIGKWSSELQYGKSVALFFGARTNPPTYLLDFCLDLAVHFGLELEWLPWLPYHEKLRSQLVPTFWTRLGLKRHRWIDRIEEMLPRGEQYTQGDLLAALAKYRLVVTDTYHLCINSWRVRTPAICFGEEASKGSEVIRDFKKRILYEMYDAQDFYFDVGELNSLQGKRQVAEKVKRLLESDSQVGLVGRRMESHSIAVQDRLTHFIIKTLG